MLISELERYVAITTISFCVFLSDKGFGMRFIVSRTLVGPSDVELEVRYLIRHAINNIIRIIISQYTTMAEYELELTNKANLNFSFIYSSPSRDLQLLVYIFSLISNRKLV